MPLGGRAVTAVAATGTCGIRGTGWCVTHQLLQAVPYQAFSLTEDVEYGIDLGLAGYRVAYADEADCDAEMVSNEQSARTQRQRWERGRFQLMRTRTWPLLKAAVQRRIPKSAKAKNKSGGIAPHSISELLPDWQAPSWQKAV